MTFTAGRTKGMKLKFDVYISLAMHGRVGRDVLDQAEYTKMLLKKAGLSYYCPPDDEAVNPHKIIDKKPTRRVMAGYVKKDDCKVDSCRVLLNLTGDKSSSGVGWEMGRMFYKNRRPIVVVAPRMYDGHLMNFTTIKATKICPTISSAVNYIKRSC
jgi:hypothetical protein